MAAYAWWSWSTTNSAWRDLSARHGEVLERAVADRAPPPAPAARAGMLPGVPWVADDRVVGLFVADALTAAPRWVGAAELDRLVGRLQAL
jgi:hypothetical protein